MEYYEYKPINHFKQFEEELSLNEQIEKFCYNNVRFDIKINNNKEWIIKNQLNNNIDYLYVNKNKNNISFLYNNKLKNEKNLLLTYYKLPNNNGLYYLNNNLIQYQNYNNKQQILHNLIKKEYLLPLNIINNKPMIYKWKSEGYHNWFLVNESNNEELAYFKQTDFIDSYIFKSKSVGSLYFKNIKDLNYEHISMIIASICYIIENNTSTKWLLL